MPLDDGQGGCKNTDIHFSDRSTLPYPQVYKGDRPLELSQFRNSVGALPLFRHTIPCSSGLSVELQQHHYKHTELRRESTETCKLIIIPGANK